MLHLLCIFGLMIVCLATALMVESMTESAIAGMLTYLASAALSIMLFISLMGDEDIGL